jgi:hypothetical protein
MRVGALILGVIGGLYGLTVAFYGSMLIGFISLGGMSSAERSIGTLFLFAIPVTSFAGAAIALSHPTAAGLLLLTSAAGWLGLGAIFGYGINSLRSLR